MRRFWEDFDWVFKGHLVLIFSLYNMVIYDSFPCTSCKQSFARNFLDFVKANVRHASAIRLVIFVLHLLLMIHIYIYMKLVFHIKIPQ